MEFKLPPIDVPADNPFSFDGLGRKDSVQALTNLVGALKGPFTVAIDSPWGTGKTTFVRMWKAFLESQGFHCLYFDAWSTDFSSDPLVAFLGELNTLLTKTEGRELERNFKKARKIATVL